ncbi:hypothetical protein IE53DRAFT_366197 [Violaceomyces palustris]|uniref:Uncharacterized protein n=1 Tax=Violaceomyces palustris TaxID=1673888 RepID=A0ACD0P6K1_9BASI|nr:hypothetical protein IE53DRAFT_366197 [Violaceomyces palustris]
MRFPSVFSPTLTLILSLVGPGVILSQENQGSEDFGTVIVQRGSSVEDSTRMRATASILQGPSLVTIQTSPPTPIPTSDTSSSPGPQVSLSPNNPSVSGPGPVETGSVGGSSSTYSSSSSGITLSYTLSQTSSSNPTASGNASNSDDAIVLQPTPALTLATLGLSIALGAMIATF